MRDVVIVAGPPAAGKSTYVARHAPPGALVVDFDAIARRLGSPHPWDHPAHIRAATRREVERQISIVAGAHTPAYVIRSAPDAADRRRLADRISATRVVVLRVPAEEAKARASRDNRPAWTAAAIDRWHSQYRPSDDPREEVFTHFSGPGGQPKMTQPAATPAPVDPAPADPTGAPGGTTPPAPSDSAPKWEGEFDPDRAARLVENLRRERDEVRARLKAREDAEKTELQRAQDAAAEAQRELAALRTQAAVTAALHKHGLDADLADFVTGSTPEEIESRAAALATRLKPADPAPEPATPPATRPAPRLVPGHAGADVGPAPFDPTALAARL